MDFNQLIPIGIRQTACHVTENYIANEFQHMFLLPLDIQLTHLKPQGDEVSGFVELQIDECIDLLQHKKEAIDIKKSTQSKTGLWSIDTGIITVNNFPPNYLSIDKIIERLLIAAKRQIDGDNINQIYW